MPILRFFPGSCAAALLAFGCAGKPRPWQGGPDGALVDASRPFLQASSPLPSAHSAAPDDSAGKPLKGYAGGLWLSCAAGLAPSGDPRRDVERLGFSCGPENGMRRLGDAVLGTIGGDAAAEVDRRPLPVLAGACYRVFVAAEPRVSDLHAAVVSPRGTVLAESDAAGGVAMVERDRPFCSFADDQLTIELHARSGRGRYALVVYELPAAP